MWIPNKVSTKPSAVTQNCLIMWFTIGYIWLVPSDQGFFVVMLIDFCQSLMNSLMCSQCKKMGTLDVTSIWFSNTTTFHIYYILMKMLFLPYIERMNKHEWNRKDWVYTKCNLTVARVVLSVFVLSLLHKQ